jgi:hypothetical protein
MEAHYFFLMEKNLNYFQKGVDLNMAFVHALCVGTFALQQSASSCLDWIYKIYQLLILFINNISKIFENEYQLVQKHNVMVGEFLVIGWECSQRFITWLKHYELFGFINPSCPSVSIPPSPDHPALGAHCYPLTCVG